MDSKSFDKFNQSKNAFMSGLLMGWASSLESDPSSRKRVINDMKEFSNRLATSAGVTIGKENKTEKKS